MKPNRNDTTFRMARLSYLLVGMGLASCRHTTAPQRGQTQFLDPLLLKKAFAVHPTAATPATPPHISSGTQREFCEQIIYPTFSFTGTLGDAVHKMMTESTRLNADGTAIGGFIMGGRLGDEALVKVDAKSINAADLIELICAQIGASCQFWPYAIEIRKAPATPTKAIRRSPAEPPPSRARNSPGVILYESTRSRQASRVA